MEACERMTELMSAALDGELTAEEQSALDAHLAQCGDCRALMEELKGMSGALRTMEAPEFPEDLHRRILDAVQAESGPSSAGEGSAGVRKGRRRYAAMIASAACVALVVLGAVGLRGMAPTLDGETAELTAERQGVSYFAMETTALNGAEEKMNDAAGGSEPDSAAPGASYSVSAAMAGPDGSAVTAMVLCYGVEELPEIPDYLIAEGGTGEYPTWLCPAERMGELIDLLGKAHVVTAVEYSDSYSGVTGEWVRVTLAP